MKNILSLLAVCFAIAHCTAQTNLSQLELVPFLSGYTDPVGIYNSGDERLFILEQSSSDIEIVDLEGNYIGKFLDLSSLTSNGGERGLLGMAFHPNYALNGKFYVNYTNNSGNTVVAEYTVSGDPDIAEAASGQIIITINQDFGNHNGGHIAFGEDGYLYIGMGDGGSAGDPNNRAQNPNSLLGKMLRINVPGNGTYSIPADNPFVGDGTTLDEIWSLGLRNPWKFSFDSATGDMWIGDVGQNVKEEINYEPAGTGGLNYGWKCREGFSAFDMTGCSGLDLTDPVADYTHSFPDGPCSITGGIVYRGSEFENMVGHYFLTDYCDGKFYSLYPDGNGGFTETLLLASGTFGYVAFGTDINNELYVANVNNGSVFKVTDPCDELTVTVEFNGSELTAISAAADSFQWFINGNAISGAISSTYTPEQTGLYTCEVFQSNGCGLTASETFNLAVGTYLAGCTQICAINYDPMAEFDDGSCQYFGTGNGFGCESCPGDFTGDGAVNVADLGGFLGAFGTDCN